MKAVIITQPGGPEVLQIAERPIACLCGPGEVLVKVAKHRVLTGPMFFSGKVIIRRLQVPRQDMPGIGNCRYHC